MNQKIKSKEPEEIWINPIGGLGDTLMLSGVLKLVHDQFPDRKYNLVRRTEYTNFLREHPAINRIGFPPKGAKIVGTTYWLDENYNKKGERAFQLLAKMFGLKLPVDEKLFLAGEFDDYLVNNNIIPWREKNIVIATGSDSPRKMMHPMIWHQLVERLSNDGVFVVQVGRPGEIYIKNTYSLLGVTMPRQIISVIKKSNLVITSDNFVMHAAHLAEKPAVVLWGPTNPEFYGYKEQIHLKSKEICTLHDKCLGPKVPNNYPTPCPLGPEHCMNKISLDEMYRAVKRLL